MEETPAIKSKRIRLVETTTYGIDLEYNDDFAILHIPYVNKFNRTVLADMVLKLEDLGDFINCMGYPRIHLGIPTTDITTQKLALRLNFELKGESQGFSIYELWVGD